MIDHDALRAEKQMPTDYKELEARLRRTDLDWQNPEQRLLNEAADAIAALRAEVEGKESMLQFATTECKKAEAEVAALKEWQRQMVQKMADESLDGYRELGAKCAALEIEVAEMRKDAERYRFFRDSELSPWAAIRKNGAKTAGDIDAAIDAARREGK